MKTKEQIRNEIEKAREDEGFDRLFDLALNFFAVFKAGTSMAEIQRLGQEVAWEMADSRDETSLEGRAEGMAIASLLSAFFNLRTREEKEHLAHIFLDLAFESGIIKPEIDLSRGQILEAVKTVVNMLGEHEEKNG